MNEIVWLRPLQLFTVQQQQLVENMPARYMKYRHAFHHKDMTIKQHAKQKEYLFFLLFSFIPILFSVWLYVLAFASRQTGSW